MIYAGPCEPCMIARAAKTQVPDPMCHCRPGDSVGAISDKWRNGITLRNPFEGSKLIVIHPDGTKEERRLS